MSSYFDEHNCEPLQDGQGPNHMLHLARLSPSTLLIDGGYGNSLNLQFNQMFADSKPPPPASKKAVEELETQNFSSLQEHTKCPICLGEYEMGNKILQIPCKHHFHSKCILPWLEKTNSCPVCRYELPTDDKDYEEFKRQKAREKQRQFELETLHDSMFG